MASDDRKRLNCAIYTRKSSEEGLDQAFNSLEAQREACEAYIASQRHEGWRVLETRYDDGGFSGGSMERPGLRQLLEDIRSRKVDVVVVYKVDRLTRALSDFAKIVEIFDAQGVSFVSVTQQFNTTSSMGRLTLNVLLSFAQFEREVTGERIRDKFAASRKKGMWMGGPIPLGYDLKDRKLVANPTEAEAVRLIYQLYMEYGCVRRLKAEVATRGIVSKQYVSETGRAWGGRPMGRGQLYYILKNRLYIGEAVHKGQAYAGEHAPIIDRALWDQVQDSLKGNRYERSVARKQSEPSLLVGLLFDEHGNRFTPSHTQRHNRRYRYYVSQAVLQHQAENSGTLKRLPAHEVEGIVEDSILELLGQPAKLLDQLGAIETGVRHSVLIGAKRKVAGWLKVDQADKGRFLRRVMRRVVVTPNRIDVIVSVGILVAELIGRQQEGRDGDGLPHDDAKAFTISVAAKFAQHGEETKLLIGAEPPEVIAKNANRALVKLIVRAFDWYEQFQQGRSTGEIADNYGVDRSYVARVMPLAFVAPDLVVSVLESRQSAKLSVERLISNLPLCWADQRPFANSV